MCPFICSAGYSVAGGVSSVFDSFGVFVASARIPSMVKLEKDIFTSLLPVMSESLSAVDQKMAQFWHVRTFFLRAHARFVTSCGGSYGDCFPKNNFCMHYCLDA